MQVDLEVIAKDNNERESTTGQAIPCCFCQSSAIPDFTPLRACRARAAKALQSFCAARACFIIERPHFYLETCSKEDTPQKDTI